MNIHLIATFFLLVGLELVLGIDNILLISILTGRLPQEYRKRTRFIGLGLALVARCFLLLGAAYIVRLNTPVLFDLSWKSLILIAGGGFLLYKAVHEIHHVVEAKPESRDASRVKNQVSTVIGQIIILDLVFSIDSVITAVGLTDNLLVIYSAVIASFLLVLAFSSPIADFIHRHATLKILALSFLVTIGITLMIEGFGGHVPKGYIYMPMGFALIVELLQLRFTSNQKKVISRKK